MTICSIFIFAKMTICYIFRKQNGYYHIFTI